MTTIEKLIAGHPYFEERVRDQSTYIRNALFLLPEPKPGEILTEEWARYLQDSGVRLQGKRKEMTDSRWIFARNGPFVILPTWHFRIPPKPKLRDKRPDELPECYLVNGWCVFRINATADEIRYNVVRGNLYTADGITFHSFETDNES